MICVRVDLVQSLVFYDKLQLRYESICRYIPFFKIAQWVVMESMQFHINKTDLFLTTIFLHNGGLSELNGMYKKLVKDFNEGLIIPLELVYPMVSFLKVSLIFI